MGVKLYAADMGAAFADVLAPGDVMFGSYASAEETKDGKPAIYLEQSMSTDMAFATLAHELGHHYVTLLAPKLVNKEDGQAFAEAVSFLVCRGVGLDSFEPSAGYLWKQERPFVWVVQF